MAPCRSLIFRASDMTQRFIPEHTGEVAAVVREARQERVRLEVVAGGSRRGYGRAVDADAVLDVSRLAGVIDYDPAELVLTARPATPMSEIAALLAGEGQHLAFEPGDQGPLWGAPAGSGTLGGMLAYGLGGPRRPAAGAPRDHFLGFEAVNGFGDIFSAGGKVIKNVTGYDLPKLLAGSMGTLAVLTEVTVKALPAPPHAVTLGLEGLTIAGAVRAMSDALNSPAGVSGAAYLPRGHAAIDDKPLTLLRLEGVPVSVSERVDHLRGLLATTSSRISLLESSAATALWADLAAVHPFAEKDDEIVWRVSLPPSTASAFLSALPQAVEARWFCDWGGGLIWLFLPPNEDGHAATMRAVLAQVAGRDGHATLMRAPEEIRRVQSPFQPLEAGLAALSVRVKERFDPDGILNPGRLYGSL